MRRGSSNHGRATDRTALEVQRQTEEGYTKPGEMRFRASAGNEGSVGQQICRKNSQPPWVAISSDSPKVLF